VITDAAIGEVLRACDESGYVLLVTADHGNAERMLDENGKPVTKHTTFRGQLTCVTMAYQLSQGQGTERSLEAVL